MNVNHFEKIIELEERVNIICKVLVVGEADHFKVEYCDYDITIVAFTHDEAKAAKIGDLMRIYAEPDDVLQTTALQNDNGKFWTIDLHIAL